MNMNMEGVKNYAVVNYPTSEVDERVWKKVEAFNEGKKDTLIEGNYFISVGAKNAMFTLWRYQNPMNPKCPMLASARVNPCHYIKNLADDLESAVDAAIKYLENSRWCLDIDRDTNIKLKYDEQIFCFGKYKGYMISDVAEKDMNYLIWLSRQTLMSSKKTAMANMENVKAQVDTYFDRIAERNRETCKSEYVGKVGDKLTNLELKIKKIQFKMIDNEYEYAEYVSITAEDNNENLFSMSFSSGTKNFVLAYDCNTKQLKYSEGDVLNIKSAKVKSTFERLGRKTTGLNFVKLQ